MPPNFQFVEFGAASELVIGLPAKICWGKTVNQGDEGRLFIALTTADNELIGFGENDVLPSKAVYNWELSGALTVPSPGTYTLRCWLCYRTESELIGTDFREFTVEMLQGGGDFQYTSFNSAESMVINQPGDICWGAGKNVGTQESRPWFGLFNAGQPEPIALLQGSDVVPANGEFEWTFNGALTAEEPGPYDFRATIGHEYPVGQLVWDDEENFTTVLTPNGNGNDGIPIVWIIAGIAIAGLVVGYVVMKGKKNEK